MDGFRLMENKNPDGGDDSRGGGSDDSGDE